MHKGLLLVSIPVCFEIGMFSVLIGLQERVEQEAQRLDHKRKVNEAVNVIIRDVAKVGLIKKRYLQENTVTESTLRGLIDNLLKEFSKLEDLCRDDPELLHSVLLSKKAVLDAKDEIRNVKVELQKVSSPEEFTQVLVGSRKRLDAALASALNAGVLDLANKTEQGADLEKNLQDRHQITIILRCAMWLSVALGLLLALWYSRSLTLRIMRLKENASLFANRKPLHQVMKGDDEIAELDRAFHEATRLIETATRNEQEAIAMITHDLRTPLQTIRNYMEMLKAGILGNLNDQGTKLLNLSERESQRMTTLINGVLTLEKLRSGNKTLNLESVDVPGLLDECANALQLVASQKKISIKIEPSDPLEIQGDRVWLEQVLINIVSNALKFAPPKTQVTMSVAVTGDNVEIRIKDQGPGIPVEDQEKIFERFHRVQTTSHRVGSGLGLSICKELIQLHHGSISCESQPGDGSTFIILLPLAVRFAEA
jgi:Signal transduction histidine kinase